jgi:hypothetical protein
MTMKPIKFLILAVAIMLFACSEDEKVEPKAKSIDGQWKSQLGNIAKVEGANSSWQSYTNVTVYVQAAVDQGFFTLDAPPLKEIKKTGDRTWTAKTLRFSYLEDNGDIEVDHAEYVDITITLSEDEKSLSWEGIHPNTFPSFIAGTPFNNSWTKN